MRHLPSLLFLFVIGAGFVTSVAQIVVSPPRFDWERPYRSMSDFDAYFAESFGMQDTLRRYHNRLQHFVLRTNDAQNELLILLGIYD